MLNLTVQKFMTPQPHTIRHDQTLLVAQRLMRKYDIRHLPVLKEGRLAGILSERDLYMVETLSDLDMTQVQVADAMSIDVYTVGPRASVRKVVEEMATHKYGSAVVMAEDAVVGIFTTIDALVALHSVLDVLVQVPEGSRTLFARAPAGQSSVFSNGSSSARQSRM